MNDKSKALINVKKTNSCLIEICALLGYYTALNGKGKGLPFDDA
jgi:hypothetical protein